eukprot:scaffold90001_cov41-Tisochrysis_lutea.AAC.2
MVDPGTALGPQYNVVGLLAQGLLGNCSPHRQVALAHLVAPCSCGDMHVTNRASTSGKAMVAH